MLIDKWHLRLVISNLLRSRREDEISPLDFALDACTTHGIYRKLRDIERIAWNIGPACCPLALIRSSKGPALAVAEKIATKRFAATLAPGDARCGMVGIQTCPQGSQIQTFFGKRGRAHV